MAEVAELRRLLDLDFDATARDDWGEKRKRDDPRGGGSGAEVVTAGIGGVPYCTS